MHEKDSGIVTPEKQLVMAQLQSTSMLVVTLVMESAGDRLAKLHQHELETFVFIAMGQAYEILARAKVDQVDPKVAGDRVHEAIHDSLDTYFDELAKHRDAERPAPPSEVIDIDSKR